MFYIDSIYDPSFSKQLIMEIKLKRTDKAFFSI